MRDISLITSISNAKVLRASAFAQTRSTAPICEKTFDQRRSQIADSRPSMYKNSGDNTGSKERHSKKWDQVSPPRPHRGQTGTLALHNLQRNVDETNNKIIRTCSKESSSIAARKDEKWLESWRLRKKPRLPHPLLQSSSFSVKQTKERLQMENLTIGPNKTKENRSQI
jgi:hypothetical protein